MFISIPAWSLIYSGAAISKDASDIAGSFRASGREMHWLNFNEIPQLCNLLCLLTSLLDYLIRLDASLYAYRKV